MRRGLYLRLAWDGLRKNRQLSWPYLLTCVGMVAMHYILAFLASPTALEKLPQGRQTIETMMALGCLVVLLFSLIFLFYTYSFLNRRRAREFGLYNVLGMGKRNLSRIVLWESAITATLAMIGGLVLGAALSKLAELGLVNLMNGEIDYRVRLDFRAVFRTVVCYVPVFALNALAAVIRTRRSSAVNLLKAESAGEKPPRGNWLLAILGIIILGVAYWMALSIKNPLDALMWFFVAVLLVIVATYMLLIAGSVWLCRRLQANKRYYYRADHFVSVSSMTYRMKRNGTGLASICIIATMVLVMLSTSSGKYSVILAEFIVFKQSRHQSKEQCRTAVAVAFQHVVGSRTGGVTNAGVEFAVVAVEHHHMGFADTVARVLGNRQVALCSDRTFGGSRIGFKLHVCENSAQYR